MEEKYHKALRSRHSGEINPLSPHFQKGFEEGKRNRFLEKIRKSPGKGQSESYQYIRNKIRNINPKPMNFDHEEDELSIHQRYLNALKRSGLDEATINAKWHEYYAGLDEVGKRQVWTEFHSKSKTPKSVDHPFQERRPAEVHHQKVKKAHKLRERKISRLDHLKSLAFGLFAAMIVLAVFMFGFFNERFIAPFMSPSRNITTTPIIASDNTPIGTDSKIIIPKINVEVPVVYGSGVEEEAVQKSLENGVVHYTGTALPGQNGNVAIVGHSSNNLFNSGKYKYAFVLLKNVEVGDTVYLHRNGKRFGYRVYKNYIVKPSEVSVLNAQEKPNTVTLITCDPPGTSLNRRVLVAEQFSPDPAANIAATSSESLARSVTLPSNAPTLWDTIKSWFN